MVTDFLTTNTTADVDFAGEPAGVHGDRPLQRQRLGNHFSTCLLHCTPVPTTKRGATSGMDNGSAIAIYPNPVHNQVYVAAASALRLL